MVMTNKDLKNTNILARRKNKEKKIEQKKDSKTKQKLLWIGEKQYSNFPTRVVSASSSLKDKNLEKITLKSGNTFIDITFDVTKKPKLFNFLMDCMKKNKLFDLSEIGELNENGK